MHRTRYLDWSFSLQKKLHLQLDLRGILVTALADLKCCLATQQAATPLAKAFALGTLLSFIPAPIIDTVLVGIILTRFKQINRPALLGARIIWNDLIVVPLYVPGFRLGMALMGPFAQNDPSLLVRVLAFAIGIMTLAATAAIIGAVLIAGLIILIRLQRNSVNRAYTAIRGAGARLAADCRRRP